VDEGFPSAMVLRECKGASPRFAERWRFEEKRGEHHPACRISVLISDREIRRIFRVHIETIIGMRALGRREVDAVFGNFWRPGRFGWGPCSWKPFSF
jgi:hypothetical protein